MNGFSRFVPWFALIVATSYLAIVMAPAADPSGGMHLQEFAQIPIVDHGRVKPFDTFARNSLMAISEKQTFTDKSGNHQPAVKWLLDVVTTPHAQRQDSPRGSHDSNPGLEDKVFRIENDQLVTELGLEARPLFWRYGLAEFMKKLPKLTEAAEKADAKPEKDRDVYDVKLLQLYQRLQLWRRLMELDTDTLCVVPPQAAGEDWISARKADAQEEQTGHENAAFVSLRKIFAAYADGKKEEFNQEVADYRKWFAENLPDETGATGFEVFFNHFEPFYQCSLLYVVIFLLACISWVAFSEPLMRAAFWLVLLTLVVHTFALIARMYIQGRPPITNLYSTAIFIGWAAVIGAVAIEKLYGHSLGNALAGVAGSLTMLVAHNLAGSEDTMQMMQAVLDTNFWLATHVVIINLGYAATLLAGLIGTGFIVVGMFTPNLKQDLLRKFGEVIYGVICFAMLFSFVGTVLGGIWGDYSWGRFWGWDSKENGALLIVLWNALILHARWGGMVKQRGMAVLTIFGNIVVTWSWFGVNLLNVGLHTYGFMQGAATWLMAYDLSQLVLIGIGCLPKRYWKSFAPAKREATEPSGRKPRRRQDASKLVSTH
jgi:ABC-type transport system involved in cytochrome c biogenesis permease subunit